MENKLQRCATGVARLELVLIRRSVAVSVSAPNEPIRYTRRGDYPHVGGLAPRARASTAGRMVTRTLQPAGALT